MKIGVRIGMAGYLALDQIPEETHQNLHLMRTTRALHQYCYLNPSLMNIRSRFSSLIQVKSVVR